MQSIPPFKWAQIRPILTPLGMNNWVIMVGLVQVLKLQIWETCCAHYQTPGATNSPLPHPDMESELSDYAG